MIIQTFKRASVGSDLELCLNFSHATDWNEVNGIIESTIGEYWSENVVGRWSGYSGYSCGPQTPHH